MIHVFLGVSLYLVIIDLLLICYGLRLVCLSGDLDIGYRVLLILLLGGDLKDIFLRCRRILILLFLSLIGNIHYPPLFPKSEPES